MIDWHPENTGLGFPQSTSHASKTASSWDSSSTWVAEFHRKVRQSPFWLKTSYIILPLFIVIMWLFIVHKVHLTNVSLSLLKPSIWMPCSSKWTQLMQYSNHAVRNHCACWNKDLAVYSKPWALQPHKVVCDWVSASSVFWKEPLLTPGF